MAKEKLLDRIKNAMDNLYSRHSTLNADPRRAGFPEYHTDRFNIRGGDAEKWETLMRMYQNKIADDIEEKSLRAVSPADSKAYERAAKAYRNNEFSNPQIRRAAMLVQDNMNVLPTEGGVKVTHNPFEYNSILKEVGGAAEMAGNKSKKIGENFRTYSSVVDSPNSQYYPTERQVQERRAKGMSDYEIYKTLESDAERWRR